MSDVHSAFRDAHGFLSRYFEDLARLLRFAREQFEQREFSLLRHNGDRYYSDLYSLPSKPASWLATWLFSFFVPMTARRRYGAVSAHDAPRVAFVCAALGTDAEVPETPALWIGWIEGYHFKEHLERREALDTFYEAVDPPRLDPVPVPISSLDTLALTRSKSADGTLDITMSRVPMRLITGEQDIERIVEHIVAKFPRSKT